MIQKIKDIIIEQKNETISSDNIFIIDYKNINGGEVEVLEIQPLDKSVHLTNENNIEVFYVAFKENALKVDTPEGQVKQCECVLFPTTSDDSDWILFIETKYTFSLKIALQNKVDYPNTMISQIISTVDYFRKKGILSHMKKANAIVSFPTLIENFSEAFFLRSELTAEEIFIKHKIIIRPTNVGRIRSQKRLTI